MESCSGTQGGDIYGSSSAVDALVDFFSVVLQFDPYLMYQVKFECNGDIVAGPWASKSTGGMFDLLVCVHCHPPTQVLDV